MNTVCRGDQIDLLEVDAEQQRMITVSGSVLKVWNLKGHRKLKEIRSALCRRQTIAES